MSYPRLVAGQSYALVDIRLGNSGSRFEDMDPIYRGSCSAGDEWGLKGTEGMKLCARYTSYPDQEPPPVNYCANGFSGISEGNPETSTF